MDAGEFASLSAGHHGVLLAGGSCKQMKRNQFGRCREHDRTPALLMDVTVDGCSVQDPRAACRLSADIVWQDESIEGKKGHRNGALSHELGGGGDPAIVLVGGAGATVYEPPFQQRSGSRAKTTSPAFRVIFDEDLSYYWGEDRNTRGSGLAVGTIGSAYPGFFVGTRTEGMVAPAPLLGVWKWPNVQHAADYDWDLTDRGNAYRGARDLAVQATNMVLVDLDGDGIQDLVECNFISPRFAGTPVQQDYFLLDAEGHPRRGMPATYAREGDTGGRSVAVGQLFRDGAGPDLALGLGNGELVLFANLGNDGAIFRGFEERWRAPVVPGCEVRDVKIVPGLVEHDGAGGSASVVCVVFCRPIMHHVAQGGVFSYHVVPQ